MWGGGTVLPPLGTHTKKSDLLRVLVFLFEVRWKKNRVSVRRTIWDGSIKERAWIHFFTSRMYITPPRSKNMWANLIHSHQKNRAPHIFFFAIFIRIQRSGEYRVHLRASILVRFAADLITHHGDQPVCSSTMMHVRPYDIISADLYLKSVLKDHAFLINGFASYFSYSQE